MASRTTTEATIKEAEGTITGTVVDAETDGPLPGINIVIVRRAEMLQTMVPSINYPREGMGGETRRPSDRAAVRRGST